MKTKQIFTAAGTAKTLCTALFAGALLLGSSVFAQVKIGDNPVTINAGSALEIESTNKGLLMPRIALTNTTTWGLTGTAAAGMHVYNTSVSITSTNTNYPTLPNKIGEYYWDGTGWVATAMPIKSTSIVSFTQAASKTIDIGTSVSGIGGYFCPGQAIGSPVPACATDLGRNGSFTITNPINDVIIDVTGTYTISFTALPVGQVQFYFNLYIDKTTPGVYELVESNIVDSGNAACKGGSINMKSVLKNLPARAYSVKLYQMNWYNAGVPAKIGIGGAANPGCGYDDHLQQKLIVSVSQ